MSLEWYRYLAQGLFDRTGGMIGLSHGDLAGLGDDDHPQYLTEARGDARYVTDAEAAATYLTETQADALYLSIGTPIGGANGVTVSLNFGSSFTDKAQTIVTGQTWVTAGSEISAQVLTPSGSDPDEMRLLDLRPVVSDIVAGVGFTVTLYSDAEARGVYSVLCLGT